MKLHFYGLFNDILVEGVFFLAAMSSDELELLYSYLPFNLNVDEAAFRRQLVTTVHTVLTRLRDSSLLRLRRSASTETGVVNISEAFGQWHCCVNVLPFYRRCISVHFWSCCCMQVLLKVLYLLAVYCWQMVLM